MQQLNIKAWKQFLPVLILCLGVFAISCGDDDTSDPTPGIDCNNLTPSYANDIKPIIDASCAVAGCHVANFPSGDYTEYDGLKEKIDSGKVSERVVEDKDMPPTSGTGPEELTTAEIQLIHCWIEDGAPNN